MFLGAPFAERPNDKKHARNKNFAKEVPGSVHKGSLQMRRGQNFIKNKDTCFKI